MSVDRDHIARVCHESIRALCRAFHDNSMKPWDEAADWEREATYESVQFVIDNPDAPASLHHENWCAEKIADGWTFGLFKDPAAKRHPCLVPFDELPPHQQAKDFLYQAIVTAEMRKAS